ncbi:MAG: hypothetical protein ACLFS3_03200 [Candidatus Aenigmatarchaeota archaeon]
MPAIELYDLIFKQILNVSQCTGSSGWGCLTGDITHDVIFAFFLPHIVLLTFLIMLRGYPPFGGHKGLGNLFAIGTYVLIIYQGWYGSILAPFLVIWMVLLIIVALGYFFLPIVGSPEARKKVGGGIKSQIDKSAKKAKQADELEAKLHDVNDELSFVRKKKKTSSKDEKKVWTKREAELENKKRKLKRELRKLR